MSELCAFCGQAHIIKDDVRREFGVPLILFAPGQFLLHATLFLRGQACKQVVLRRNGRLGANRPSSVFHAIRYYLQRGAHCTRPARRLAVAAT